MRSFKLKAGVIAIGVGFGAVASAQSSAQQPSGAAAASEADGNAVETVVVTATRRTERLLQTPIAASVLSGATLTEKGVLTADSLQFVSPSVVVNNYGQGLAFNIRGIGKAETNAYTTTGVITYRDGVPSFPGYFQSEPYFDVANIQILRGPQGTVVGQNATGGAVFVNTNDPKIGGGSRGDVEATYGNYKDIGLKGAINLPISDSLAARIAFFGNQRDSFYTITGPAGAPYTGNPGNVHQAAVRVSLLWWATENLSFLAKTDVNDLDMGAYPADPSQNRFQTVPGTNTPNPTYSDLFNITANAPQEARDRLLRSSLKAEYSFDGGVKFRSITGTAKGKTKWASDFDGTASGIPARGPWPALPNKTFSNIAENKQSSQEFNVISPDNQALTWLLGAFYVRNDIDFPAPLSNFTLINDTSVTGAFAPFFKYQLYGTIRTQSTAAFGQVGYALTPSLKLEVGGRYTASKASNQLNILQAGTAITQDQAISEHNSSYKASLGWKLDANNYLYALTATGFKPGGINLQVIPGVPAATFGKETIQSSEAGWKSTFAGGQGRMTFSAFYNSYKNFQVTIGNPTSPTFQVQLNVPGATKISGIEAEADFKTGALTLTGGIGVINSSLGQFYAVDLRFVNPFVPPPACNRSTGPANATCSDLKGRQLTYSPALTYNVGVKYDLAVGAGKLTPSVNFGHVAAQWATLFQNSVLGDRLGARNILGAQLTYKLGNTSVTAYGTNLTNQHYVAAHWSGANGNLDFAGAPRQFGIKLAHVF